jgi:primary-amine oxidase
VEALRPNKTDALKYLDKNGTAPTRYAHVLLDNRASVEPCYADIIVGPLPIDNKTAYWAPLTYPYNKKSSPGKVRNLEADDEALYTEWLYIIGASVADITLDLWNGTAMGLDNDTLDIWGIDPLWQDDGRIIRWDTFWNYPIDSFDSETLLPLGLYFMSDVTGRDTSKWKIEGWLYNDCFYDTLSEFRAAYWSEGFEKFGPNVQGDWARSDQQGPIHPMDTLYPPTQVAPAGNRFKVDAEAKYVEWMDYSFYIGFTRDAGMALYDIRYKVSAIMRVLD